MRRMTRMGKQQVELACRDSDVQRQFFSFRLSLLPPFYLLPPFSPPPKSYPEDSQGISEVWSRSLPLSLSLSKIFPFLLGFFSLPSHFLFVLSEQILANIYCQRNSFIHGSVK